MTWDVRQGHVLELLRQMPAESVHCVVTSPPYWGLRSYKTEPQVWGGETGHEHEWKEITRPGMSGGPSAKQESNTGSWHEYHFQNICSCGAWRGELGLEPTPELFVQHIVEVFREVKRVLRKNGTLWMNLGDSYAHSTSGGGGAVDVRTDGRKTTPGDQVRGRMGGANTLVSGLKPKDLCGIPWSVAKAFQAPYYTGRIKDERDRVWLAAMIDAEGSICGFTHQRKDNGDIRNGIHITITNSNVAILDKCFQIWPTTREEHNPHSAGHLGDLPTWRWIVHGIEQKSALLQELYPYFVGKRKQALLAWNFLEISRTARGRNKGDEGTENREKYTWVVSALSRLNHLEPVDIPSWCKEPPNLYQDGWYLRSDIIWAKPNPMPESVTDRPTKAHEYLFLLAKNSHYFFDQEAVREKSVEVWNSAEAWKDRQSMVAPEISKGADLEKMRTRGFGTQHPDIDRTSRNLRTVWTIPTQPFPEAHFATFPEKLVEPCIRAGTSEQGCCAKCGAPWEREVKNIGNSRTRLSNGLGQDSVEGTQGRAGEIITVTTGWHPTCQIPGYRSCNALPPIPCTVLDPFCGSGTTGVVALKLQRSFIGLELQPDYVTMARKRIGGVMPLFESVP